VRDVNRGQHIGVNVVHGLSMKEIFGITQRNFVTPAHCLLPLPKGNSNLGRRLFQTFDARKKHLPRIGREAKDDFGEVLVGVV
jgi:hypothetical protein